MSGQAVSGFNKVYNCHDMAECTSTGSSRRRARRCSQGLEWVFNVSLPPSAQVLRLVAMPAEQLDPSYGSDLAVQQNAYDWVDLVGGFV